VPTYQKMQAAVSGRRSVSALLHSLKSAWVVVSVGLLMKPARSLAPPNFAENASVPELQSLLDAIRVVRRKVLANTVLRSWVTWVCWVLAGMILLAAISPKLAIYTAGTGVLAAIGTVLIFVWAWRTKPSAYDAACRLDSAAGLHDRASTALFFGAIANPEGIISLQRRDALARVSQVNSGRLFPIRAPALAARAVILAVVVAGFFVYRMYYRPPLTALLQSTVRSHLMQALLAPLEHALEQNLQRNTVQADPKQDAQEDQKRISGSEQDADALWATAAEQNEAQADAKKDAQEMDLAEQGEDEGQQGAQGGTQSGDSDTEAEQSQEGNNGSDSASSDSQQGESQNSESGKSLAQSLMQALKNMMSGQSGQRMPSQGNQQRSSQGMPQSGSSDQSGKEGDRQQNSQAGRSNSDQKATQNNGNGAGNQPGNKELKPNPALPVRAVPDRVALQSSTMKDQMRMRNGTETGTAHLAVRPLSPKAIAVINGRDQENIPARYRLYVQHYFEHADNGQR
jgi:hypothetical protein